METISARLRQELPGLRGFSARSIRNMRIFFEEWQIIEARNLAVASAKFTNFNNSPQSVSSNEIRQLELANLQDFPLKEFLSISFSHHIAILTKVKSYDERVFYIKYADTNKVSVDGLEKVMKQDLFHHQDKMPNNFLATIPDYKKAYRTISMFKDEYLLEFINVAYLAQLSSYLRILNDDDRRSHEEAPIGIILCKNADKAYAEYIMQDFRQPMGVATYKTADEMNPELLKVLPPKEELQRVLEESSK